MMGYCNIHATNNCIECAIDKQTTRIVNAIEANGRRRSFGTIPSMPPPPRDPASITKPAPVKPKERRLWLPHWLGGHDWQREVSGILLHIGSPNERQCDIVTCRVCGKAKVSYGDYPPRRSPGHVPPRPLPKAAPR